MPSGQSHIQVICSLPIYYRSEDKYYEDQREHEEKNLKNARDYWNSIINAKVAFESSHNFELVKRDSWWPPWKYNDIVGYLEVYCDGGRFKSELLRVNKKRIGKNPYKRRLGAYVYKGKISEAYIPFSSKSNESIKQSFLDCIYAARKYLQKMKRFLDTENIEMIAAHLDFVNLLSRERNKEQQETANGEKNE